MVEPEMLEAILNKDVCHGFIDVIEINEIMFSEPITKAYMPVFHMLIGVDNA